MSFIWFIRAKRSTDRYLRRHFTEAGVEYMVSPKIFETLDPEEQKLWHSHVYEVKSGMLFMPKPAAVPETV